MALQTKPQPGAGRIFKNPVLEALTKTHISIPLTLFWSVGAITLWYSMARLGISWRTSVTYFLGGMVLFTLVEYLMHRFLYHIPAATPGRRRFQYVIHGIHHEHPRDKQRLAMPPVVSLVLATLFIALFRLTIGPHGYAFGGGFLFGYSTYLLAHYAVHIFKQPKNFLGAIWKHHNLHHYVGDDGAFGVSSPFWDYIFGTMPTDPRRRAAEQVDRL
ncbi:MAG: sterol desaturase family protein [Flavobacteriales bacterium]|nr:sterol desaturase family protein [Flavobacteriales bacterium]MBP9080884.1 sterol desaturase family protein [Flavobacteriales bacterium]